MFDIRTARSGADNRTPEGIADCLQGPTPRLRLPDRSTCGRIGRCRNQVGRETRTRALCATSVVPALREAPGRIAFQLQRQVVDRGWREARRERVSGVVRVLRVLRVLRSKS